VSQVLEIWRQTSRVARPGRPVFGALRLLDRRAVYTRNGGAGGQGGATYNLFSAGLDSFLPKRTDVYAIAVYEKTSGIGSLGQSALAQIIGLTP
jgi:hypothetical protein